MSSYTQIFSCTGKGEGVRAPNFYVVQVSTVHQAITKKQGVKVERTRVWE